MLGPMPKRYRSTMAVIALVASLGIGLWLGALPGVPVVVSAGVVLGLIAGVALAWVMIHDWHAPSHRTPHQRS